MTEVAKMPPTAPATTSDPMVAMIERVVMDANVPMERLTALIDIRERQMEKEAEQAFNAAFAAAMAEMPDVPKTGWNPHLKRKYPTLDDLIRTARPVLARHGLSLNWQIGIEGGDILVRAIVRHALGHSIDTEERGARDKSGSMNALQGGGSTQTYLKRYTGFAILGLSAGDENDDDGRGADTGTTITEDQYRELRDLIEQAGITEEVVCAAEKVDHLPALPASKFDKVRTRLNATIKEKS